mmetsp:Transcript_3408/g.9248  ORF Transcript_3408/g.9248 Transcript_3408/m.9248 type:complete len:191 (+) Transcript_3408:1691-2263(+)
MVAGSYSYGLQDCPGLRYRDSPYDLGSPAWRHHQADVDVAECLCGGPSHAGSLPAPGSLLPLLRAEHLPNRGAWPLGVPLVLAAPAIQKPEHPVEARIGWPRNVSAHNSKRHILLLQQFGRIHKAINVFLEQHPEWAMHFSNVSEQDEEVGGPPLVQPGLAPGSQSRLYSFLFVPAVRVLLEMHTSYFFN